MHHSIETTGDTAVPVLFTVKVSSLQVSSALQLGKVASIEDLIRPFQSQNLNTQIYMHLFFHFFF